MVKVIPIWEDAMIEATNYTGDGTDAACITVVRQETTYAGREVVIGPALYGVATWGKGPATLRRLSQDLADAATWLEASPRARPTAEAHREAMCREAARIRRDGPGTTIYTHCHSAQTAQTIAADLRRSHPNPGVRYEVAEITEADAYPADCSTESTL